VHEDKFQGGKISLSEGEPGKDMILDQYIDHPLMETPSGNPDILICGNCRELFNDLVDMLDHKKHYCKMRFTCKCEGGGDHISESQCSRSNQNNQVSSMPGM
jgi:hypothetical protein